MSVVIGAAFPDFALLLSDSRVTIGSHTRDELQKLFRLSSHLAIGYASNNVPISLYIIQQITRYALEFAKSQHPLYLLDRLPKAARYHYREMTKGIDNPPRMEFIYAGAIVDRASSVPAKDIFDLMKKLQHSFALTPVIQRAIFSTKDGYTNFPPPTSVILRQRFPQGDTIMAHTMGIGAIGSGAGVYDGLVHEIEKIFLAPNQMMQIVMLQTAIQSHLERNPQIRDVGGLNQVLLVDKGGVKPLGYETTRYSSDGKATLAHKMVFDGSNWIQVDGATGKHIPIKHFDPLWINMQEDYNFGALGAIAEYPSGEYEESVWEVLQSGMRAFKEQKIEKRERFDF